MKRLNFSLLLICFANAAFAWQADAPDIPYEENEFNWTWWILGVVLVIAFGMMMYSKMKKNPRRDVR